MRPKLLFRNLTNEVIFKLFEVECPVNISLLLGCCKCEIENLQVLLINDLSISHTKQTALPKYYPTHFDCEACTLEFDRVVLRCRYISVCRWPRMFTYIYFRIIDYRTHSRTRISCSYDDSCMRMLSRSRCLYCIYPRAYYSLYILCYLTVLHTHIFCSVYSTIIQ